VRLEEIGIAFGRLPERGFGLGVALEGAEDESERAAAVGPGRGQRHRPLDVRGGRVQIARAQRQDTEQMPGAGVRLVAREDLAAGRLGFSQASGRLLGVGALEQPLQRGGPAVRPFLRQLLRFHPTILGCSPARQRYHDTMVKRSPCVTGVTSWVVSARNATKVPGGGVSGRRRGEPNTGSWNVSTPPP